MIERYSSFYIYIYIYGAIVYYDNYIVINIDYLIFKFFNKGIA